MTVKTNDNQTPTEKAYKDNISSLTEHAVGFGIFGLGVEGLGYAFNDPIMYGVGALVALGSILCLYDRQKCVSEHKKDCTPK